MFQMDRWHHVKLRQHQQQYKSLVRRFNRQPIETQNQQQRLLLVLLTDTLFIRDLLDQDKVRDYQLIYMLNIRKVKKQRFPKLNHNEEQIAAQKLLQISCFWDQKFEDGSHVLSEDVPKKNDKVQSSVKYKSTPSKQKSTIEVKAKINSPSLRDCRMALISTSIDERQQRFTKAEQCIFNTVESNRVFVGNKLVLPTFESEYASQSQPYLPMSEKMRIKTEPQQKKNVVTLPLRINLTEFRKKIGRKCQISNKNLDLRITQGKQSFLLPNKLTQRDRLKRKIFQNTFRNNFLFN